MGWIHHVVASAPEVFLFLAVAIGNLFGRIRIGGFAIGATACTLFVAVILGQLGVFVIPSVLKSILFGLFVFTIILIALYFGVTYFSNKFLKKLEK